MNNLQAKTEDLRPRNLLQIIDRPGLEDLTATLELQQYLLEQKIHHKAGSNFTTNTSSTSLQSLSKITDFSSDFLIFVEHSEIYTSGRSSSFELSTEKLSQLTDRQIPWLELSRGGKTTFHGPGQLVIYPIFDLERHGQDVHLFLRRLEKVVCLVLESFGVPAKTIPGLTGVWIETSEDHSTDQPPKKVAAIGIGVRKWISYHGIAININPDLRYFQAISPCGFDGNSVTSLAEFFADVNLTPTTKALKHALIEELSKEFNMDNIDNLSDPNITQTQTAQQLPQQSTAQTSAPRQPKPSWLKVKAPGSPQFLETHAIVRKQKLVTVCEEAKCPNIGECWSHHTATFMIMGELCTRRCSFCAVKDGLLENLEPLDPFEPYRISQAIKQLGLQHVVITSVNRDDLADMGAKHFDQTVRLIAEHNPSCKIELLIPDMRGRKELVETILQSGLVSVLNHNVETVPRLYKTVRPGAIFSRSLKILTAAKDLHSQIKTKSGVMLGLGESLEEVVEVMSALRESKVDILTLGQYLQPTTKQLPVSRYVPPEDFAILKEEGLKLGFSYVESGPLVRSSYHAWQHSL